VLRIAIVHYSALPVIGGVETVLAAHALLLREHGHEVRIVARTCEPDVILSPPSDLPAALRGCDCVIVHNILTMPFDLPLTEALWRAAESTRGTRWIAWVHDLAACNPDYTPAAPILSQASPHFEYIAVSELRAGQFQTLTGIPARVIPNGIDPVSQLALPPYIAAFAERHALFSRDIVLLHPTRLLRRKNVELSIAVTAALRASGTDAVLIVTGAPDPHNPTSADYAESLFTLRRDSGLEDSVLFAGEHFPTGPDTVAILYRLADALFFPSRQEGFGLPMLEAALQRLPIFAADIPPLNSLFSEPTPSFSLTAAPGKIAALISRILSASVAHRLRKETLRQYSWRTIWGTRLGPLLNQQSAFSNDFTPDSPPNPRPLPSPRGSTDM
jgi:mannosylglucosylglycerate synthase